MDLITQIQEQKLPKHIAVIMDGNGRWAKQRGVFRTFGHQRGSKTVKKIIKSCANLGIEYLTLYVFSTENWNRPQKEVDMLMRLIARTLKKETPELIKNKICLKSIGKTENLPVSAQNELHEVISKTKDNDKMTLTLALNYGAREEITTAVRNICDKVKKNIISVEEIEESIINEHLYTQDMPEVDLLIRTSGEQRISNFLLWQIAYSELYFTETLWPDFDEAELYKAIISYQKRERRFGKISEQVK